ncbi:hypothetical protein IP68_04715 [Blastomonas sp. AAP25]|uniref:DUF2786 domain-containing protein n=1 Tax=Blastomonas sp. AAP25 TaxID=1523416 RepID=UPI0006B998A4|nr:DUF2786 domain-containing protein [Blastomonas sp. AAP25]KPF75843.1 hypothetical protein IP68_04715 [Blastomonas sp. AAP25]
MIDKQLLLKIRKCLQLARSANEHEAATALAKARELMEAHGITDDDLAMAEIDEATARSTRNMRPPVWECHLNAAVNRALGTISFLDAVGDRCFVGRGPTPTIASYAFAMLFRQLKIARSEYIRTQLKRCKPGRKRQRADVFSQGWAYGVVQKVRDIAPERREDPAIERWLAVQHPGLAHVDARRADVKGQAMTNDFWRGHESAGDVDLNHGVAGSAGSALLAHVL